jgi:3-dehydroquinate synthase
VVTDIGGFAASTFMRGIRFVHMPTTLLGMVDASIGGKTGIDFGGAKNIAGSFADPELIIAHLPFLNTLPDSEWRNGAAEMIKHMLVGDVAGWNAVLEFITQSPAPESKQVNAFFLDRIGLSAAIKQQVVTTDPFEQGLRAALNFGHTVGHAIEAWSLEHKPLPLSHGECIAAGMICEAFLSVKLSGLSEDTFYDVIRVVDALFPRIVLTREERGHILEKVRLDKKRSLGDVRLSLISAPALPALHQSCTEQLLTESLHFYAS